jgi:acetoacetyl-CoA synthetase
MTDNRSTETRAPEPLWRPSPERIADANMTRFIRFVAERFSASVESYAELYQFSLDHTADFWTAVWEFCGIRATGELHPVVDDVQKMPGARWFANVQMNFAQNLLRHRDDRVAIISRDETDRRQTWTYAQLHDDVYALSNYLRQKNIGPGDRVAAFMPNIGETVVVMLATATVGAIFSSCSPDFGVSGVVDRFGQIQPKLFVCTDAYSYGGKVFSSLAKLESVLPQLPSVESVLVVQYLQSDADLTRFPMAETYARAIGKYASQVARSAVDKNDPDASPKHSKLINYHLSSFAHPLYIMFSSGTTGVPKCIVHSAGGTLIQHLKELVLHTDVKREDHLFYYTTCGWMMWNWMVSTLAVGATLVLFDGSPMHPTPAALWDLVDEEKVSVFGTSAKWISASEKAGVKPAISHKLTALRTLLSTGSPLSTESFDYVYRDVKARLLLASISGGTDLLSCFALGNPLLPVYRGELQCRGLGMRVQILNDDGEAVIAEKGELSCTRAFPSMPIGFWNDPSGEKYHAAYFDKFPNIWCHGDHAELSERGGLVIYGRSDATLNPGGVRIGTAEIYRQVEKLDEVLECLAIGQNWQDDVRVVLFVRLRDGVVFDEALVQRIKTTIRKDTTPRHVPAKIIAVADLPRTRSGKITELAVRNVVHNLAVKNTEALANPESLALFANLPELQS